MPLPEPSLDYSEASVTVGTGQTGSKGRYNVSGKFQLPELLEELQTEYSSISILRGEYDIERHASIVTHGMSITGVGNPVLNIRHSGSVGVLSVEPGVVSTSIRRLVVQSEVPRAGQSALLFQANGSDHEVSRCRFLIHPSVVYTDIEIPDSAPMRLVDFRGVCGKTVHNNTFLPYTGTVPIYAEGGSAGAFNNNRVHNGLNIDLDHLVGFQTFPYVRPCLIPIHLKNERQGWVRNNYVWAVGDPAHSNAAQAAIQYDYDSATAQGECGHMDFSGNKVELCYAPRMMRLRGLQYSTVSNNNFGVSSNNIARLENDVGRGALVIEPGIGNTGSKYLTVVGNNLHNPGKMNSEAAAIYARGCSMSAFDANHLFNLFNRYGLYIDDGCTDLSIRGGEIEFNVAAVGATPVRVTGPNTARIAVGDFFAARADAATPVVSNAAGPVWTTGLGKIQPGPYGIPEAGTPAYLLSTIVRGST